MANILIAKDTIKKIKGVVNISKLTYAHEIEDIKLKLRITFDASNSELYRGFELNVMEDVLEYTENQKCNPEDNYILLWNEILLNVFNFEDETF